MAIFAFTVGSLGDIISLIQLAKAVTKALCDSKGSSEEYFELVLEIDSVVHTVEGVEYELSVEGPNKLPAPVENGLHHSIRRCLDLLQQMNAKISAWRRGFGSGWTFGKDAWRKLGWCLFTREELISLRRRLSGQIEAMNTLLILAHGERLERFSRKQDEHALEIRRKQDEIALEIRRIAGDYLDRTDAGEPRAESWGTWQPVPDIEYTPSPTDRPAWRSVHSRSSRRSRREEPLIDSSTRDLDELDQRSKQRADEDDGGRREPKTKAGSWATWEPDPNIEYTPPPSDDLVLPTGYINRTYTPPTTRLRAPLSLDSRPGDRD